MLLFFRPWCSREGNLEIFWSKSSKSEVAPSIMNTTFSTKEGQITPGTLWTASTLRIYVKTANSPPLPLNSMIWKNPEGNEICQHTLEQYPLRLTHFAHLWKQNKYRKYATTKNAFFLVDKRSDPIIILQCIILIFWYTFNIIFYLYAKNATGFWCPCSSVIEPTLGGSTITS